jgi:molecular chaperone HtpG
MSSLVNLEVKQPEWSKSSEEVFIGKDILELLSTSMYVEPLSLYREYVQNAADSIEATKASTETQLPHDVQITIDRHLRSIRITDRGAGLSEGDFYRKLTSIGGSSKRGTKARGFRGVGRLAGLAFCQELIFRTRAAGSNRIYEMRWDTRKVRALLRAADARVDLATIVAESVETRSLPASLEAKHFFEVELRNVVRHRDDRLLNAVEVSSYLSQVAPVAFHPEFSFGEEITSFLAEAGVALNPLSINVEGEGLIFRPHRDVISSGGKLVRMHKLETLKSLDRDGNVSAASWILHHDYVGSLSKATLINGWRFRSGNIQVGDNALLEEVFPETRFNGWTIAETHVLDRKIVPNGRRDNYEHSAHFSDLQTRLTPFAREIAHRCRTSSITRNAMQKLAFDLDKCEEKLTIAQKPRTPSFVSSSLKSEVALALPAIERIAAKALFETPEGEKLRLRLRKVATRLSQIGTGDPEINALSDFPSTQRGVIKQIIEAIHVIEGQTEHADKLVGKILARLRKQRASKTQ